MIPAARLAPLALALLLAGCAAGLDDHAPDLSRPTQYRVAQSPSQPPAEAPR